jgi:hypothetical protein
VEVATQIGCVEWDHDLVTFAGAYLVIAERAAIRLHGFVRLDVTDLDGSVREPHGYDELQNGRTAQTTSAVATATATPTNHTSPARGTRLRKGL